MSDRDALLAAIIAQPDEDTPRLALADWLEEHGDAEDRARAWWIRHTITSRSQPWDDDAVKRSIEIIQGCPPGSRLPRRVLWGPYDLLGTDQVWSFRRGFPEEFRLPLAAWQKHGSAVVRRHPVRAVRLADRVPHQSVVPRRAETYLWVRRDGPLADRGELRDELPSGIFDRLRVATHRDHSVSGADGDWCAYPTADLAHAALSAAAIAWAKARPA